MNSSHVEYLRNLEVLAAQSRLEDLYLWPRTPLGYDHQEKITDRVGVPDYDVDKPSSRPALIIRQIRELVQHGLVGADFSLLDIACGDAIVLWQVKKAFPQAQCYGIDCNIGQFGTHEMVEREGVELFNGFIQHLFVSEPIVPFDLALMLNTYRGWESADLRKHEQGLPKLADAWLAKNVRYTIVTATDLQIRTWRQVAFVVARLGKGEDNSTMVCVSKSPLPRSLWQRLVPFG
jgi:hypothetical protein